MWGQGTLRSKSTCNIRWRPGVIPTLGIFCDDTLTGSLSKIPSWNSQSDYVRGNIERTRDYTFRRRSTFSLPPSTANTTVDQPSQTGVRDNLHQSTVFSTLSHPPKGQRSGELTGDLSHILRTSPTWSKPTTDSTPPRPNRDSVFDFRVRPSVFRIHHPRIFFQCLDIPSQKSSRID